MDGHVMFLCDFTKIVWLSTGLSHLVQHSVYGTSCEILTRLFENRSREQYVEIAMVCWSLWTRKNRWVWGHANGSVFGVRHVASHLIRDWKEAQMKAGLEVM